METKKLSAARIAEGCELHEGAKFNAVKTGGPYEEHAPHRKHKRKVTVLAEETVLAVLQLVAGILVTASSIVGYALHPALSGVVSLMGVSLFVAGATGLLHAGRRLRVRSRTFRSVTAHGRT